MIDLDAGSAGAGAGAGAKLSCGLSLLPKIAFQWDAALDLCALTNT